MRRVVLLNGDGWQVCAETTRPSTEQPSIGSSIFARVPGNVRSDLLRHSKIPDPHDDPDGSQWVDRYAWRYRTQFSLEPGPRERGYLVLEGVDYRSWVYLNDHLLTPGAGHEGMFSRQVYEVTAWLGRQNTLSVLVEGSDSIVDRGQRSLWKRALDRIEPAPSWQRKERFQTVKCQMGYGWDFAPCVRTMGVWDDVYLIRCGGIFLRNLWVRPLFDGDAVSLAVRVTVDALHARCGRFRLALSGRTFSCPPQVHTHDVELEDGLQVLSWTLPVKEPSLWWPWDRGQPNLYRFVVEAYLPDGVLSDAMAETVGLRQVTLTRNPGAPAGRQPWVFNVNGKPIYLRGANWVPVDILPGGVSPGDYQALLEAALEANMNALRVWGGGLREKRAFYDLCDEMGFLVWQEFPFACAFVTHYPRSAEYLDLVEREARAIVRSLRNHPSIVLWCGGNEFSPRRHRALVDRLETVVGQEDGTRPFSPASPHAGDAHDWDVWHGLAPVTSYATGCNPDDCQLASEYGLQAPPSVASLRAFIPADELWPPGPAWQAHGAQLARLKRYARPLLRDRDDADGIDLDTFVGAAQRAQAIGLQIAVEHLRRRKYSCSGTLIWQLNEPWPAISWSLIDYYGRRKPAYETIKRIYAPVLVSLEYPIGRYVDDDPFVATVWVINDRSIDLGGCCAQVTLHDAAGTLCESWLRTITVEADSAKAIGRIEWRLPKGGAWTALARLFRGAQVVSENDYDLSFYDSKKAPLLHVIRRWMARMSVER